MLGIANLGRFFGLERRLLLLLSGVELVVHANNVSPCHVPIMCALHGVLARPPVAQPAGVMCRSRLEHA
jgi:hypothetical protein